MLASRVKSFKSLLLKKKFGRKARGLKSAPMVCQAESQSTGEGVFFPPYVEVKQTPLAHSSSFSRPIGTLEKLFEDISEVGGGPIDREHTAFFTVLQVRFPPVVTRAEDHIARAWEEVGRQFPALRASISSSNRPDGNKQSMITVQPWSESNFRNSFTVHPGCPNVDVLFSTPSPRRTTATCHWLPDPGQVVIRTAHWRTDGFGLVLLSQTFLSTLATTLRAGISAPLSNNSASQPLSVPPSLEDLVRKHVQDHPGTAADADDLANIFVDGGRSIGFPTRPGASTAAPTVCERVAIRMDAGNSAKLVSACRTLGFSVTSAVNAAVIRTAARFPQEPGADAYVVFAPVDLRAPLMAAGAQECSQPTGNYVSGLPLRVDGVAKPSESGDSVPGKRFGELVHELGSIYSQDVTSYRRPDKADAKTLNLLQLSEPYIQRMAGLYSKFPAPGCPFPKTPVISSFGNMDTFIKQEYRSSSVVDDDDAMLAATKLNVTDFWVGCDCARPMIVFNPYSWGGEFTLLAAWDHSYYSKEFVLDVLEKTMAELYEGLEMGQTPYRIISAPIPKQEVSIAALAERISSSCSQIRDYLAASSLPEPTFVATAAGNGGGIPDTIEYEALRAPLNDALHDLLRLINGPVNTLTELVFSHYDLAALQIALDRRFFDHVPLPEAKERELSAKADTEKPKLSVAGIARKAGMDEDRTGRVLGLLATHRIFEEVGAEVGAGGSFFAHTASSAFLARNPDFHAVAEMQMDDMFRVAPEASAMISGNPFGSDPSQSVFHQRHGTSLYQYYEQRPEKARRFARAMSCWSQVNRHVDELYGFPWASLGNGTVVDVGGGNGHTSVELARMFPSLQFIVQDISPHMLSEADQDVGGRVTFQQHDFFNSQPVRQASAFVIRQCLHNYDDPDAARILRAVVPALEQCAARTPLLISDIIVPEPGTAARCQEHHLRQIDCCMMVLQGAKERTKGGFNKIIKEADERLQIISVRSNPMGLGLVEVHLIAK